MAAYDQSASKSGSVLKRGRCDECKRRKKRCIRDGRVCDFCKKKGLECNNYDALQIVQFEGPQRKKVKNNFDMQDKLESEKGLWTSQVSQQFADVSGSGISMSYHRITPSALVKLVKENLPKNGNNGMLSEGLSVGFATRIYLPTRKWVQNSSNTEPPILQDETTIKVFDNETTIPTEFSLQDFLLSSTRVNLVDLATCHLEEPVSFAEIDKFLKATQAKRTMETLKERGYLVASKTSNIRGSPFLLSPTSPIIKENSATSNIKHTSPDEVDFVIDLENLKSHYYVQKASVTDEIVENENEKFANLPEFIEPAFADELFQRFCAITQETSYTSDLELTSFAVFESTPDIAKDSVKINFLKICLPLIFGNVTVLKCVLIVSYYRWKQIDATNEYLLKRETKIRELHIGVLEDLQERLSNCFSLCCDHSLLAVALLMSAEVIKGLRGPLWRKLLKLTRDLIALRGGVSKLIENLTGLCLLKLLSIHLSIGGLFTFQSSELEDSGESISLIDFFNILDSHPQLDFYDNLNYHSRLGLNDMKDIVRVYGHITQLYNLSAVSYDANNRAMIDDTSMKLYGSYDSVSLTNLELVLNESEMIERHLTFSLKNQKWDNLLIPVHHKLQSKLALKISLLYIYQSVHRQTSLSPKTVLLVKSLLEDAEQLFGDLCFLSTEESQKSVLFILPLFLLGVDLVHKRTWYKDELIKLYNLTKKEPLMTCVYLLEKIWELNPFGSTFVDWRMLSQRHCLHICLCA